LLLDYSVHLRHEVVFLKIKYLISLLMLFLVAFIHSFVAPSGCMVHLSKLLLRLLLEHCWVLDWVPSVRACGLHFMHWISVRQLLLVQTHLLELSFIIHYSDVYVIGAVCCVCGAHTSYIYPCFQTYDSVRLPSPFTGSRSRLRRVVRKPLLVATNFLFSANSLIRKGPCLLCSKILI
jgi:hypothetical protein